MTSKDCAKTMRAWQKHLPGKELLRVEVPVPSPQGDEILVKIHAAGVCHSDYNIKNMAALPPEFQGWKPDFTMGHEGCGEVISTGRTAHEFAVGDKVAIMCVPGCGASHCHDCSIGLTQICPDGVHYGGGHDGFFAPYAVVRERAAVLLPEGVSFAAGAVATDACMTAHHAVVNRAQVSNGSTVLLLGLGGLGFNALQIAQSLGARVIVTDQRQVVLDEAEKIGVSKEDIVPADTTDIGAWVQQRGLQIDAALDFVGVIETFKVALETVRKAGTIVLVGLLGKDLSFATATIIRRHLNVLGSYGGTLENVKECLDLIQKGLLVPQVTLGKLKNFPSLLEDLHNGKVTGRMVMVPDETEY